MSYLEKFFLDKTAKKYACPACGKKRFVVYIDAETNEPVDEYRYGRCDREAECGHHDLPKVEKKKTGDVRIIPIYPDEANCKELTHEKTNLHLALEERLIPAKHLHDVGVLGDRGMTVYVFRNQQGQLVNFKWFKYNANGKRDHDFVSHSLKQPEQANPYYREAYSLCLFLEQFLDPERKRPVCVVESEKTAVIAKFFYPDFDWVSCGSASGLSDGSEGTANKIPALKGREVYWICDADDAGRGKYDKEQRWIWPSSVRNLIKYIEKVHVVDLFPERDDGYDLGDALLEGIKPELKPTWSKNAQVMSKELHDKRQRSLVVLDREQFLTEFRNGKPVGDSARIDGMKENFSWMRTFVNCWTGWPNDGKTTFFFFMALLKAISDNWKFCVWSPEMINSRKTNTGIHFSAVDIVDELVFMLTGKNPYKHFDQRYGIKQMTEEEYLVAVKIIEKHFIIIQPKERPKYTDLLDNFKYFHEKYEIDGFLIDPFKNLEQDHTGRSDLYLDKVFTDMNAFAKETNTCFNIIAHPKTQDEPKDTNGAFKVCTQHMLNGGSSWFTNMDGIYSIYRPYRHKNPTDPLFSEVSFFNLKQRKQALVGKVGVCKDINFDWKTNRYYFNGRCPIDGSFVSEDARKKAQAQNTPPIQFEIINFSQPTAQDFDPDETPF